MCFIYEIIDQRIFSISNSCLKPLLFKLKVSVNVFKLLYDIDPHYNSGRYHKILMDYIFKNGVSFKINGVELAQWQDLQSM